MMVLTDKGAVHCVCKDRFVVHHGTPRRVARRGASRHVAARRGTSRHVAARRGTSRRVKASAGVINNGTSRFIVSHTEVCLRTWLCRLCASCHTSPWAEFAWGQALRLGVCPVNRILSMRRHRVGYVRAVRGPCPPPGRSRAGVAHPWGRAVRVGGA